jgi:hypothetical protein
MTGAPGGMAEWLKAHAWKACVRETVPWVRIPLPPRDGRKQGAARRVLARKLAVPEWTICGDGEIVLLAPG